MFYIRADGNTEIGMGHVMRCLSIAEAAADIKGLGAPVFLVADEGCKEMITDRGFQTIVLGTDYKDMMSELPQLKHLLNAEKDILLVDSYQASAEYYMELGKFAKVACLEDMGVSYPVDLLINYNIYALKLVHNYAQNKNVLLGTTYIPLRKQFQEFSDYQVREHVSNVVITTGGSDPHFAAGAVMDAVLEDSFLDSQNIQWHILSGPFNKYLGKLKEKFAENTKVIIHENIKDMRSLLLKSDVVISATGSTIYEVSSLGVPMVVFYFAENQRQGAEALEHMTDIVNAGCFTNNSSQVTLNIVNALKKCIQDRSYREGLYFQEKSLVDGKGAYRIAESLCNYMHNFN